MKYRKTQEDFNKHLATQLKFLKLSSKSYDEGFEDEAQRLATAIRVLMHDTNSSTSLLKHMNIQNNIYFISSAPPLIPVNQVSYTGLVSMSITGGEGGKYYNNSKNGETMQDFWLGFNDWWNQIVIDDKKNVFSRKDLILYAANKEGGAHVDESLNEKYSELTRYNSTGWVYSDSNISKPFNNDPVFPSIRQIVEEVILSIEWHFGIKTYRRVKTDNRVGVCYINNHCYMRRKSNNPNPLDEKMFQDSRVTRNEIRKVYIDNLVFKNGETTSRNVVI